MEALYDLIMFILEKAAVVVGMIVFFTVVVYVILTPGNFSMFTKAYARRHRVCGGLLFCWLLIGFVDIAVGPLLQITHVAYDIILGVLGTLTAVTAAYDFKKAHNHIRNIASGTLDKEATVTFEEMIEHSFYQGLNLVQIVYIHILTSLTSASIPFKLTLALLATSPWLLRGAFPVNKFSDNYNRGQPPGSLISILYRLKKYQYIFYKHFLLHGLTVTIALEGYRIGSEPHFRLYWLCLNLSYVMEFFLQTLVKKGYLLQNTMLLLQQVLMIVSTIAAVHVLLENVNGAVAGLSLGLNLVNRKKEVLNFMIVCAVGYALSSVAWVASPQGERLTS